MVSIIIPCYNLEQWIARTLQSVVNQTDPNWELIIIDDGSSDNSAEVINNFKDSRIKFYQQPNRGVSAARNVGLMQAKGEWVYFLDGDDEIDKTLVEKVNNLSENTDVIITGFEIVNGKIIQKISPKYSSNLLNNFLENRLRIVMCSICFKKSFLEQNSIVFDELTYFSEDREFIAKSLLYAQHIIIINDILFSYIRRESSAMGIKKYNSKKFTSIEASERMYYMLKGTRFQKSALVQLKTTVLLHWIFAKRVGCTDELLKILYCKLEEYLTLKSKISFSRDALFSYISSIIFKNKTLFRSYIKYLPFNI